MEIVTERLHLRPVRADDLDFAMAIGADERVMNWLGGVQSVDEARAWLERQANHWQAHGFGRHLISAGKAFVGFAGLSRADLDAGIVPGIEIAWRLAFDAWGKGYATEAAGAVLHDAFASLDVAEIVAATAASNARSRRVMERLRMAHARGDTFEHPNLPIGHPLRSHVVYRVSRDAYIGR